MRIFLRSGPIVLLGLGAAGCQNMLSWGEAPQREVANQTVQRPVMPERPVGSRVLGAFGKRIGRNLDIFRVTLQ